MTERNLRNGWSDRKKIKRFLGAVGLFNVIAWITDATRYEERLEWELFRVKEWMRNVVPIQTTVNPDVPGGNFLFGLFGAIVAVVYVAITVVCRESFKENWYITLRRVPNYRGKYLRAKLTAALFPIALYAVYGSLQWAFQRSMYHIRIPEALRAGGVWKFSFGEVVLIPLANLALFAISVLLLSFVLRNVKKDIIGCIVAISGIGMMVVCKHVLNFSEGWQRAIALSGAIGVEVLFLVRHVYRKL